MSDDLFGLMMSMNDAPIIREDYIRAPFAWPGAKSRSLEHILPLLPYSDGYCEPFGGTGAVLLARRQCPLEVFNDRFSGITCFYRVLRDKELCEKLYERLELVLHSREEFIWCKNTWKNCEDEVERAARWWYTVVCSFGAQGRNFGRSTGGPSQMGKKLKNNLKLFNSVHCRLQNVQIENQTWQQCLKDYDSKNMIFYLDPPYYHYYKGQFECEMEKEEHVELLERIFQSNAYIALSGYKNQLYEQYSWDEKHSWHVHISMTGMAFNEESHHDKHEGNIQRNEAEEFLYIKYGD